MAKDTFPSWAKRGAVSAMELTSRNDESLEINVIAGFKCKSLQSIRLRTQMIDYFSCGSVSDFGPSRLPQTSAPLLQFLSRFGRIFVPRYELAAGFHQHAILQGLLKPPFYNFCPA